MDPKSQKRMKIFLLRSLSLEVVDSICLVGHRRGKFALWITKKLTRFPVLTHNAFHSFACRLGMRHQLLVSIEQSDARKGGESSETQLGVPLMKNIKATSLSILAEPYSKNKAAKQARRAVIFVSSTDTNASEMQYAAFQLQLNKKENTEKKSFSILTKTVISGMLKDGTRSVGPISSIFLTGASFRFDLKNPGRQAAFTLEIDTFVWLVNVLTILFLV